MLSSSEQEAVIDGEADPQYFSASLGSLAEAVGGVVRIVGELNSPRDRRAGDMEAFSPPRRRRACLYSLRRQDAGLTELHVEEEA